MRIHLGLSATLLTLLCACSGGGGGNSGPPPATQLVFTPAPGATGYRLALDAHSTSRTVVLDLYGPAGATAQGIACYLTADPAQVAWVSAGGAAGTHSLPQGALNLGAAPQIYADQCAGGDLQVGLFQKTGTATFTNATPIVSVALSLQSNAAPGAVALAATAGKQAIALNADGTTTPILLELGSLQAN